jgi:hypothetical protein
VADPDLRVRDASEDDVLADRLEAELAVDRTHGCVRLRVRRRHPRHATPCGGVQRALLRRRREPAPAVVRDRAREAVLCPVAPDVEEAERDDAAGFVQHRAARVEVLVRLVPLAQEIVELDVVVAYRSRLVPCRGRHRLVHGFGRNLSHRDASVSRRHRRVGNAARVQRDQRCRLEP